MEVGKKFADLESYNQQMAKGLQDKLFFLEHLPEKKQFLFVDFGCADGTLIDALYHMLDEYNEFIGYDVSEQMIDIARTKISEMPDRITFTSNWDYVCDRLKATKKVKVLVLSSVIHEVYSYAHKGDVEVFWKRVLESGFDYICVRDMMTSADTQLTTVPEWKNNITMNYHRFMSQGRYEQFVQKWGDVSNLKSFLHFLLKYRWQINWNREVNENYFPIDIEDFLSYFEEGYNLSYFKRFRVPFLEECIYNDFRVKYDDPNSELYNDFTHVKMVFSKKHKYSTI